MMFSAFLPNTSTIERMPPRVNSPDLRGFRAADSDKIIQHAVHCVFIKYPQVAVGVNIVLERFQFHAPTVRHIGQRQGPEIRQPSFWTDRSVLRRHQGNGIVLELVWKNLQRGQFYIESFARRGTAYRCIDFYFLTSFAAPGPARRCSNPGHGADSCRTYRTARPPLQDQSACTARQVSNPSAQSVFESLISGAGILIFSPLRACPGNSHTLHGTDKFRRQSGYPLKSTALAPITMTGVHRIRIRKRQT